MTLCTCMIVLAISVACNADILFMETFDQGATGWTEYSNCQGSYYVDGGWYHMVGDSASTTDWMYSFNGDDAGTNPHQMSVSDYSLYCKVISYDDRIIDLLGRASAPIANEQAYVARLFFLNNEVEIKRWDGTRLSIDYFVLNSNEEYWVKFDLCGSTLELKIWQGTLYDEPSGFASIAFDTVYAEPGSIGLGVMEYGHANCHAAFDSVIVFTSSGSLNNSTWGCMKAAFR